MPSWTGPMAKAGRFFPTPPTSEEGSKHPPTRRDTAFFEWFLCMIFYSDCLMVAKSSSGTILVLPKVASVAAVIGRWFLGNLGLQGFSRRPGGQGPLPGADPRGRGADQIGAGNTQLLNESTDLRLQLPRSPRYTKFIQIPCFGVQGKRLVPGGSVPSLWIWNRNQRARTCFMEVMAVHPAEEGIGSPLCSNDEKG